MKPTIFPLLKKGSQGIGITAPEEVRNPPEDAFPGFGGCPMGIHGHPRQLTFCCNRSVLPVRYGRHRQILQGRHPALQLPELFLSALTH